MSSSEPLGRTNLDTKKRVQSQPGLNKFQAAKQRNTDVGEAMVPSMRIRSQIKVAPGI